MDFTPSPRVEELKARITHFMERHVNPAEPTIAAEIDLIRSGVPYPPSLVTIRRMAKAAGLWNLFLPDAEYGAGLKNWEYGMLAEIMGRSLAASSAFNCAAPDTGNMEILAEFGTAEQKKRWLEPLLEGDIRSCFSMTEPEVAGSDPTLLRTRAVRDGKHWVINGHKWFTSGAIGASVAIVMTVTNPDNAPHLRASMILVPHAGWKMDTAGKKEARQEISMIKVVAANICMNVLDRAIQVHGALGVSDDTPLARMWRDLRMLRLADGPDEVHKAVIARRELKRFAG